MPIPDWLPDTLPHAINYYKEVQSQDCSGDVLNAAKRKLILGDLFYLLAYGCNRKDVMHPWLFDRCREVQKNPNGHIDLWGRDHYKSTVITFALTIQDVLNDPEDTICIFSHTNSNAKKFVSQIKREFENNGLLKSLFPDVLWENPERDAPVWSLDIGLTLKRKSNPKEATIQASGVVEGQRTGDHYRKRIYDDIVVPESVTNKDQIDRTTEAWEMSCSLGSQGGIERYIGTRYNLFDTYSTLLTRKVVIPRIYPATHNGRMDGMPVFFTKEIWNKKLKNVSRSNIASQYLQNPLADEDATFRAIWLKPYEIRPRTLNIFITCDPSKGLNATSDNTAIAVIGISSTGGKYLLDGYCHRMTLSQRWVCLRDLYMRWSAEPGVQNIEVGYERYGAQSDDEYFQERMQIESKSLGDKVIFPIQELSWTREGTKGEQGKRTRVERLEPDFRNGRFFLPLAVMHDGKPCVWHVDMNPESKTYQSIVWKEVEGLTKLQLQVIEAGSADLVAKCIKRFDEENKLYDLTAKFMDEYLFFPFGEYKDLVDAASRLYDMEARPPVLIHKHAGEPPQFWDS